MNIRELTDRALAKHLDDWETLVTDIDKFVGQAIYQLRVGAAEKIQALAAEDERRKQEAELPSSAPGSAPTKRR